MELIDKTAIVAEIEKRKEEVSTNEDGSFCSWADESLWMTLDSFQTFVNTLDTTNGNGCVEIIKTEIQRRVDNLLRFEDEDELRLHYEEQYGTLMGYKSILSFIDTLETKEMDLNKELSYEDYKGFFEKYPNLSNDWGFEESWMFAQYFFELGLKAQKGE